ncbi:MAG: LPS export ABC transporter permease LptG [Proteobacteria bacterium]|nr:LPS export ABC transporter permease LptG [Desulfobacula sp.]MBU3954697.1 LPS export ABC transporter permease LptG [Pseudomonadota bacterium]MBU4130181.1 LPS export ABC transporter permease LptG [Pseudomonadota bacterium]
MHRLHKYWLKEFSKLFLIIQMMIMVLFVFIDYLSRMDRFLKSDISLLEALWYVLLKVPFMFVQLTPASLLLAVIVVFGVMNRNNELIALKSSGISVYFLVKPALWAGFFLAGLIFLLGETLIPISMAKANYIRYNQMQTGPRLSVSRNDIWIRSENKLIHINYFDPVNLTVAGITVTTMGDGFKIIERTDAQKGSYEDGNWVFEGVIEQVYEAENNDFEVKLLPSKRVNLKITPKDLGGVAKKSDEMSYFELRTYVQKIEREGYDPTSYRVDMNGKIAFPFICIIMALAGAATGMRSFVKHNMPVAIAIGVVICFFYWVMYGLCLSMGYATILPPVIAAWVSNLVFLCMGSIYLINSE